MLQYNTDDAVTHRTDPLRIEEDLFPEKHTNNDDGEIIDHAFPAGHILQQAPAATDQQICTKKR